ncbi:DMT family transporter [Haloglomus litoreum]|uniref:DMT family transporter n=1 Tax=Haloglomus litoreum TaxID=3034026 RepID=UPI0023E815AE|nr:EamA family transporter [Haloglomus sp. DT116]
MSRRSGVLLFGTLATAWGLSFPVITVGLRDLPPILFAAFRYGVAAVLLLAYVGVTAAPDERLPTATRDIVAILAGGVFLVGANALLFVGQQTVPSGVAAILQGLVPIITTLWALLLLDQQVTPTGAAGIVLGFVGVGLIVRPDPANLLDSSLLGEFYILAQVVLVALGGVLVDRAKPTIGSAALTGWSMALGGVLLYAASLAAGEGFAAATFSTTAIGAILYLGVFSTALAFVIYFTILDRYGALETSLVAYLVPVVATVAGILVLNEQVTLATIGGFVVVFVGFALLKRRQLADLLESSRAVPGPGD